MNWNVLGVVTVGVTVGAIGGLLLKHGASRLPPTHGVVEFLVAIMQSPTIIAGVAAYIIPSLLWIQLLRTNDLSKVQPMLALAYVATPVMAAIFLGETLTMYRWIGMALIIAGVGLISQS